MKQQVNLRCFLFSRPFRIRIKKRKNLEIAEKEQKKKKMKQNNHRECRLVYVPWPHDVTRKSRFLNPVYVRSHYPTLFPLLQYVWNILLQLIEEYSECKAWWPFNKLRRVTTRHVFIFLIFSTGLMFNSLYCSVGGGCSRFSLHLAWIVHWISQR